ncbi:MAG: cytochrome c biogenesis protein CcsA [Rhodothermaceae bacterium]|nr:cytochrome c biogenesis protein CcsA [Rhodothermaceae bacterium]
MLGIIGELALLTAFVACIVAGIAFLKAAGDRPEADTWRRYGRLGWMVMIGGVTVAAIILWILLFTRDFSYSYPFQHTSYAMPWRYTFSAFWAGQEGSFLLWIMMTATWGGALLWWATRTKGLSDTAIAQRRFFEPPVMAIVALCQFFLLSMVAGLQFGDLHIGASPFQTIAEKFPDAPFIAAGGVPADGQGLNDLLQNPWMVIHPPTLFMGFTLMMVPFAFAVAGLWKRQYTQWVKPALPWSLAACGVLILGIMMGGYWAYVTLSFGGWWAWDPVENSSLVPWIFGVAALHAMIVQKKTSAGHKAALLLSVVAFQLVIYSTFLTRSGILGDTSVHSFVDLGLYNQLLLWILSIGALGFGFFALRYRDLPSPQTPPATLSRESMIFTGALLLALTGLVIALGTSAPIFGNIFRDNPSAVPIAFYNTWTIPLAIGIAFLAGLGQLFWWRKMDVAEVNRVLLKPLALTVASTAAVLLLTPFVQETVQAAPAFAEATPAVSEAGILPAAVSAFFETHGTSLLLLLLLFCSFFALYGNSFVLWRIARGNPKLAGGSLTHVGFGLVLLGIFSSSVFNDPVSDGTGTDIQGSRDNFVVPRGQTLQVDGYTVTYTGVETNAEGRPVYLLDWTGPRGERFQTSNVVYQDGRGQWIQHPFVREGLTRDLYVATFPSAMSDRPEASQGALLLQRGQERQLGGGQYVLRFEDYDLEVNPEDFDIPADSVDLAVAARLTVTNTQTSETRTLLPVYIITSDRRPQFIQNRANDWGLGVSFVGMDVEQNAIQLIVEGTTVETEEWVVVQAYEKPFISVLWIGTLVLLAGFAVSVVRRAHDARR